MDLDNSPPAGARARLWPAGRPWLLALLLWLVLAAVAAAALWQMRRDALSAQTRELGLLSLSLTDEIDRGLRGAEEGLMAMRRELHDGRLPVRGADTERALNTRADLMQLVTTLWLLDAAGGVISASHATPPPPLASFAPVLTGLADDSVAVSRPFGAGSGPERLVALAMRFRDSPGGVGGWIVAGLPAGTLLGAFSAALPATDARMVVLRSDGVRLVGANVRAPTVDEATVAQRLANRPSLEVRRFSDGSENLVGLHRVPRYGIQVLVSREVGAVLADWRGAALLAALALALLGAIMAAALVLVQRADRRRGEAQRALAAQLARASKLESLGTLAGGVAHDFNNVLAGIVGYGEMAQDAAAPGSAQARHLGKVLQAALRGKALVERILAFSRGGARASTVFELEAVVHEVLTLLSSSLRPGVVLETSLQAPGARLRGDPTQAFEAVMNLCTNALQAMPGGGMLSLHLVRETVAAARVLSHSQLQPGRWLVLSVADEGAGITPAVMDHLFEPFFTTRSAQSGTGLGLAVVHGVVAEFGGAIDVRSQPGQGARFTLYLPESDSPVAPPVAAPAEAPAGRGQRVMVVDDEPELVALALETLHGLGYEAAGHTDGATALQALHDDPGWQALITDEVMPGLSGTELTRQLRAQGRVLPVLLVSGWGGAALAQRASAAGVTRVLAKPLQRAELARALAELLG